MSYLNYLQAFIAMTFKVAFQRFFAITFIESFARAGHG